MLPFCSNVVGYFSVKKILPLVESLLLLLAGWFGFKAENLATSNISCGIPRKFQQLRIF
jgi:hypothetical protein